MKYTQEGLPLILIHDVVKTGKGLICHNKSVFISIQFPFVATLDVKNIVVVNALVKNISIIK